MQQFSSISFLQVVAGMSFRNLQELTISKHNNIQYMFSFAMVESLIQLKKLSVLKCKAMEQIVTKAVGEDGRLKNIISFPKLESLELEYLPHLKRFCDRDLEAQQPPFNEKVTLF